jgi:hypothetical protein
VGNQSPIRINAVCRPTTPPTCCSEDLGHLLHAQVKAFEERRALALVVELDELERQALAASIFLAASPWRQVLRL